jgi:hypothetical protein
MMTNQPILLIIDIDNFTYFLCVILKEHKSRSLQSRMLSGIFWPKRESITGGWR